MRVTNIQRFSLQDGPGIRTTVFIKGCSICCPWCANPENISFELQNNFGFDMLDEELVDILLSDRAYYATGGGITFSGGEPLLQIKHYEKALQILKAEMIGLCVETSLFVPLDYVKTSMQYFDLYIIDIKILLKDECSSILGGDIDIYLANLDFIMNSGKKIILRFPLIKGFTDTCENLNKVSEILTIYAHTVNFEVEIFGAHNLAESKYKSLGLNFCKFESTDEKTIEMVIEMFCKNNIRVRKLNY